MSNSVRDCLWQVKRLPRRLALLIGEVLARNVETIALRKGQSERPNFFKFVVRFWVTHITDFKIIKPVSQAKKKAAPNLETVAEGEAAIAPCHDWRKRIVNFV
jgi:hypothetical protein